MNKMLSGGFGLAVLLAVGTAQAAEVMTNEQMDTVTAGASARVFADVRNLNAYLKFQLDARNTSATVGSALAYIAGTADTAGTNRTGSISLSAETTAP